MAERPTHLPPPIVHRVPERVGPVGEDVAHYSDRQLALRTLNEVLHLKADMVAVLKQSNLHGARITTLEGYVESIAGQAQTPVAAPVSAPELPPTGWGPTRESDSYHDIQQLFGRAGAEIYRRMKDPRDPMDSERAKAIAAEAVDRAKGDEARAQLAAQAKFRGQILAGLIIGIGVAVAVAVGGIAWGIVRQQAAHDEGVAETEHRLLPVTAAPPQSPVPTTPSTVATPSDQVTDASAPKH